MGNMEYCLALYGMRESQRHDGAREIKVRRQQTTVWARRVSIFSMRKVETKLGAGRAHKASFLKLYREGA